MNSPAAVFQSLCQHVCQTRLLRSVSALLEWDQQTQLPKAGSTYRAEQVACLAGQIHERETDSRTGEWLSQLAESELAEDRHSDAGSIIHELQYRYEKKRRLPLDLVQRQAALHSRGQQIWVQARSENNFASFAPTLAEIFSLKREEAQATSENGCLYDALLDDYEPGARTDQVTKALADLRDALIPLIARATESESNDANGILHRHFAVDRQEKFVREVTHSIGFDYDRGRLDIAHHPFCTEIGPDDCRITTRYDDSYFNSAFFGCLHEAGHGMYEQGLRRDQYGLPPGSWCSLGIHESQSRMWENLAGRSDGFWRHFFEKAQDCFPEALGEVSRDQFVRAINQIRPSLIRVEADEATYNMHIIVRFELEQALLDGDLSVDDLPEAWNRKYEEYLGITPPNDSDGVLQDIHWSAGLVGYFPTYSLGNIYASQLFEKAMSGVGDLETQFSQGKFDTLLTWLRENVHQPGNRFRASELMERITGASIDHDPLVRHLTNKVNRLASEA